MKRPMRNIGAAALLTVFLGGCLSGGMGPRETIGSLGGAVGGAFAGNRVGEGGGRILATAAGTLVGATVGADIGRSLDRANQAWEARARAPRGHSQQTPVPGFAPAASGSWPAASHAAGEGPSATGAIRDAQDCRALKGGLKPAFACRNGAGHWFVLQ